MAAHDQQKKPLEDESRRPRGNGTSRTNLKLRPRGTTNTGEAFEET